MSDKIPYGFWKPDHYAMFDKDQFEKVLNGNDKELLEEYFLTIVRFWNLNTLESVKYMVSRGVNPRMQNDKPFIIACGTTPQRMSYFLDECGADLDAQDSRGLIRAIACDCRYNIIALLNRGITITENVILMAFKEDYNFDTIELFLNCRVDHAYLTRLYIKYCLFGRDCESGGWGYSSTMKMLKALRAKGIDLNKAIDEFKEEPVSLNKVKIEY